MTAPRKFDGNRLVVATHNKNKLVELEKYLAPLGIKLVSAGNLNLPEPEETETTFVGNAVLKARAAMEASGEVCLADDSGLAVSALDGAPGIYSARWSEDENGERVWMRGMTRIQEGLGDNPDRSAKFVCAIAMCWPDGHVETVEGYAYGDIVWPPRGENGFGYDPVFLPKGQDKTFGEISADEKRKLSHRSQAIEMIMDKSFT